MELRCSSCNGTNLKSVSLAYDEGLYRVDAQSRLRGFLFGSDGMSGHGSGRYCSISTTASASTGIAGSWARYSVDLAHNFVLADGHCNRKKRDRLPACKHLAAWTERNAQFGAQLGDVLGQHGIVGGLAISNRVAQCACAHAEAAGR